MDRSRAYELAEPKIQKILEENPSIEVVIDLHRDALGDGDVTYKTMAELDGQVSSQLMMLVGTGEGGLYHPEWSRTCALRSISSRR